MRQSPRSLAFLFTILMAGSMSGCVVVDPGHGPGHGPKPRHRHWWHWRHRAALDPIPDVGEQGGVRWVSSAPPARFIYIEPGPDSTRSEIER